MITAELHACPTPGCLTFPYATTAELAEHTATGDHVFPPFGTDRQACTDDAHTHGTGEPTGRPAPAPTLSDDCKWRKNPAGQWIVRGPARIVQAGATVTVVKANGDRKPVTIDTAAPGKRSYGDVEPMAEGTPAPLAPPAAAARPAAARGPVPEGLHVLDGEAFKVALSAAGRPYAKRLVGTSWQYEAGAIRLLSVDTVATLDQAREYGQRTGNCCVCGRTLTNPASIKAGIGPVCARKF